jgi:GTPase-activating protein SAC7
LRQATAVEGIFRLNGSEERIKQLQVVFDSPPRYGKGLDWGDASVHDAANILCRYLEQMPEPVIPLTFYGPFGEPLRDGGLSKGDLDINVIIKRYQKLVTELPPFNRQLLLYILDLLAVFASKSNLNKMTSADLAAIFQRGVLSNPKYDKATAEYRLSLDVTTFLIEHQDHFLIGMQGTAMSAQTVEEVESGGP